MPYGNSRTSGRRSANYRFDPDLRFGGANFRRHPGRARRNSASAPVKSSRAGALETAGRLLGGVADAIGLDNCSGQGFGFYAKLSEAEVKLLLFLVAGGTVLVGFAACALVMAATRAMQRAKAGAKRHDASSRKALRTMHEHARHRPPTPEMLLEHWKRSRTTLEGKILLGSLMGDLAASVDASYVRGDEGEIVGRQGGIRGWLSHNAPGLLAHYKTLMHYKTVADKFRLGCGLQEPDGAEEALGETLPEHAETAVEAPARHPKAAELLEKHRTMSALETALNGELGLIRCRRRAS